MNELQELYQQVIIDHGIKPRNIGKLTNSSHHAEGFNPLCGDQLSLYLDVQDNVIKQVKFESKGCAISNASASLMSQFLKDKTLTAAEQAMQEFTDMVTNRAAVDYPQLGKLTLLAGVKKYPVRVKCATLVWHTLKAALTNSKLPVTTE